MNRRWVKQLTRENTLLDRSLRALAYDRSIRELGNASISKSPVVGIGRITSLYYDKRDYKKQQAVITREVIEGNPDEFGKSLLKYLEKSYEWSKMARGKKYPDFETFFNEYNKYHSHARGAIVYGYWGEPVVSAKLKKNLKRIKKDLDYVLSVLSTPHTLTGKLVELKKNNPSTNKQKEELLKELKLNSSDKKLTNTLSWFTLFYELGERVSSELYETFTYQLKKFVERTEDFKRLEWYDPHSLLEYFHGEKLAAKEIAQRKRLYILLLKNHSLRVLTGAQARIYYRENFYEKQPRLKKKFTGTVASKGFAKGKARIVITLDDQDRMQKGEILVSTMTTPSLMTAVHKASAIVTDEGGLTAHAAIVARELNIPCIVGTKIATQILKNGDLIEVDANKGTVKKLQNK